MATAVDNLLARDFIYQSFKTKDEELIVAFVLGIELAAGFTTGGFSFALMLILSVGSALKLMIEAVGHYDGYIVQSTGDGIFALFGVPLAHEDYPQRALYAALRHLELLPELRVGCRPYVHAIRGNRK